MMQQQSFPLNVKALQDSGEFSGYGSVFHEKDRAGDIILPGAFSKSIEQWRKKGTLPPVLWQHNLREPLGVFKSLGEDDHGLHVTGQLLIDDDPNAKRIYAHLKAGSVSGLSIGFILKDYENKKDGFYIKELDLMEISLVTVPANDSARIIDVKTILAHGDMPSATLIEKALRDVGFSHKQAKAFMAKGLSALLPRDVCDKDKLHTQQALSEALSHLKSLNQQL